MLLVEPVMTLEHALTRAANYIGLTLACAKVMRRLPHCHGHGQHTIQVLLVGLGRAEVRLGR